MLMQIVLSEFQKLTPLTLSKRYEVHNCGQRQENPFVKNPGSTYIVTNVSGKNIAQSIYNFEAFGCVDMVFSEELGFTRSSNAERTCTGRKRSRQKLPHGAVVGKRLAAH
ncbi:hypothetical protein NPIL_560321 [Nephila pilipes]|uniref:Uncharacterized protein n=1 Tax=Nephila pilipes TaxID=299642 RepID=A0A8X6M7Q3_NEPPI|nr:hypothetical protein NPIL_560321 [Nephila pilipes]